MYGRTPRWLDRAPRPCFIPVCVCVCVCVCVSFLFSESNPVCVCVPFLSGVLSGWFAPFREHSCMCVCHSPLGVIRVVCVIPRVFLRVCVIPLLHEHFCVCFCVIPLQCAVWVVCALLRAFMYVCVCHSSPVCCLADLRHSESIPASSWRMRVCVIEQSV